MSVCSPENEDLLLLCFADLLGRDQGSTEMEDSGITMIHVGDTVSYSGRGVCVCVKLLKKWFKYIKWHE